MAGALGSEEDNRTNRSSDTADIGWKSADGEILSFDISEYAIPGTLVSRP
jgi:hypothetical protein